MKPLYTALVTARGGKHSGWLVGNAEVNLCAFSARLALYKRAPEELNCHCPVAEMGRSWKPR